MKNTIIKVTILLTLSSMFTMLNASPYVYNTRSLVAIEGSYNSFDVQNDDTPPVRDKEEFAGLGLKIGAQTDNYRLFLSARNNFIDGYSYAYSVGSEAQYLLNFASFANFFIGVNGGYSNMRFIDSNDKTREVSSPYFGGDSGINVHLSNGLDLELGVRVMSLTDASHLQDGITYTFDNIITGYASIIFKYSMEKY